MLGEVLQMVRQVLPAGVTWLRLWISSTSTRSMRASTRTWQTASAMSVTLARVRSGRPRKRAKATEGSTPQANQLAAGISTALYATLEGIAISIPAIFFYALFRNRIARLSLEVGMTAEVLLEQFAPGVRSVTQGPGPSPANAPAAHPHPFAVSAALAAAATPPRAALPSADH